MEVRQVSGAGDGSADTSLEVKYAERYARKLLSRYKAIFDRLSKM